jgi:hypothetical protein
VTLLRIQWRLTLAARESRWVSDELDVSPETYDVTPDDLVEIQVGQTPVLFELWHDDDVWFAGGTCGSSSIALQGRKVNPGELRLGRLRDLEPLIIARNEWIADMRGEL